MSERYWPGPALATTTSRNAATGRNAYTSRGAGAGASAAVGHCPGLTAGANW